MQPRVVKLITQLRAEHTLVLQTRNEVVVDLRSHERLGSLRCAILVSSTQGERIAATERDGGSKLHATVKELCVVALAVRVVRSQTVAHLAVTLHRRIAELCGDGVVERSEIL